MKKIHLKRVYEQPSPDDGARILVERLWPRGLTKDKAGIDVWAKDIAPSPELRRWFGHDPERWAEFRRRYREELKHNPQAVEDLLQHLKSHPATFVYAARDEEHNSAVVLKDWLEHRRA